MIGCPLPKAARMKVIDVKRPARQSRTDTAARRIAASPDTVYAAFADPNVLMAWLPPQGMRGRVLDYEFRVGGQYRIELSHESGGTGKTTAHTDMTAGRFLALEPDRRVVMSVVFDSDDPAFAGEMVMTWSFAPVADGTEVTVVVEQVPPGISAEDHAAGLASTLANLDRYLARLGNS